MLVAPLFGAGETVLGKTRFVVGAMAALNDAITPRTRFFDQGVDAPVSCYHFSEGRLAFGMGRIAHRVVHRVIRKGYEKGGNASNAR